MEEDIKENKEKNDKPRKKKVRELLDGVGIYFIVVIILEITHIGDGIDYIIAKMFEMIFG